MVFNRILLIFLSGCLSAFSSQGQTVSSPDFRCTDVQLNGDVILSWIPPADPLNNFVEYQVYGSTTGLAGPFNLLGTAAPLASNTFLHAGANAQVQSWSYYLITRYNPGPVSSTPSDTLTTISLNVANPNNGTAQLSWNAMSVPAPPGFVPPYSVYRQVNGGVWNLIGNTTSLNFRDTIDECLALINYRVEANDASGCSSFSSLDGDNFQDQIGPGVTTIDSVSVNCQSGSVVMGWQPNAASDEMYYFMYRYDASQSPPWVKIDSISANSTFTSIPSGTSCGALYSIAAFDSCALAGLISSGHKAMCLNYDYSPCLRSVDLTWTQYRGWTGGVSQYQIYYSRNSGPNQLAGVTTASDTTFTLAGLGAQDTYCFFIRAVGSGNGFTSSSNCICFFSQGAQMPAFHRLEYVTVKSDSTVELQAIVDTSAAIRKYRIERSDGTVPGFNVRAEIPLSQLTSPVLLWVDDSVEVAQKFYTYRVIAIDSCNLGADTSNLARTILLNVRQSERYWETELSWTPYIDWASGISHYSAFSFADTGFVESPFAFVSSPPLEASHNVETFYTSDGRLCYFVRAFENFGDGITSESQSNTDCINREPLLFIPNAFTPGGLNPVFKPQASFVDYQDYSFRIFDRWGQLIFHTNDLHEGWDGTVNGSSATSGMYIYMVKWRSASETEYVKRGNVTLIRVK